MQWAMFTLSYLKKKWSILLNMQNYKLCYGSIYYINGPFSDFGDYSDQYYSVQTTEGEQIAQLIAGYIDIILKKQKVKDHVGIEGDDGSTLVEDIVSPYK